MQQILYSCNFNISYTDEFTDINKKKYMANELEENTTTKDFAEKRMREFYQTFLARQFENMIVLSGSGTSVGVGQGDKTGQTMKGLWKNVVERVTYDKLNEFAKKIKFRNIPLKDDASDFDLYLNKENTDLEALLSTAKLANSYLSDTQINHIIDEIKSLIREKCSLKLPDNSPHEIFLKKATSRKLKYSRLKIFTLNYDLLFEQAASKNGFVVIDGFSFSFPRQFNGVNFDYDIVLRNNSRIINEENYASRVFHLYKPHGSLDWQKEGHLVVKTNEESNNPLMIYPSSSKFEASFEQPYFEMMARFQQELRKQNTLLLVIGFSFYDKHIKAMIFEALDVNPSITLVVISPSVLENDSFKELKNKAKFSPNIILISEKFNDFSRYYPSSDIYDFSQPEEDEHE